VRKKCNKRKKITQAKTKTLRKIFTQRTQAPANRNGRSKQPIIEAANQALALLAVFVYATQASHATTQCKRLRCLRCVRCVRLNGRASL